MYKWAFLEQYHTSDLKTKEVYKMNFTIIKLKKKLVNREEAVTFCGFINAT